MKIGRKRALLLLLASITCGCGAPYKTRQTRQVATLRLSNWPKILSG